MKILLTILLSLLYCSCYATQKDYTEGLTPLSVMELNLYKFNEYHCSCYETYRKIPEQNFREKALSFVNYVSVEKDKEPFKLNVEIELTPLFHNTAVKDKELIYEIILENISEELYRNVSREIKKKHLFGKFEWMAFSNTNRQSFYGNAIIAKGKVTDVKVDINDYGNFIISKKIIELHGHLMIEVAFRSNKN